MTSSRINSLNLEDVRRDNAARTPGFFCLNSPVSINHNLLIDLKQFSDAGGEDVRLSLHKEPKAAIHDMIILQRRSNGYRRPHCHSLKGETWHLLEGKMGVFVFDNDGGLTDSCLMEPGGYFLYRLEPHQYHTAIPLSDFVIYHESKLGPFLGDADSLYPTWAPDNSDPVSAAAYQDKLINLL